MGNYLDDRLYQYSEETFMQLSLEDRSSKHFVLKCLARNGLLYGVLSDELKQDMEIKMVALKNEARVVYLFGKSAMIDIDFTLECLRQNDEVFPLLPVEVRGQAAVFQWALKEWGVDAYWGMSLEYFQNVQYMVQAISSPSGENEDLWFSILNGAGDEAYFSKIVIEQAFLRYGNTIIESEFKALLQDQELREQVRGKLPDDSWMEFFEKSSIE